MRKLQLSAIVLTLAGVFVASNIYTFIPIYDQVSLSLHAPERQVVIAGSLFTLLYAIGLLCFGFVSELFGKRVIIVWGMFSAAIATLLVGISNDIAFLYFARCLQGFTLASFAPMAFAYIFDLFHGKHRTLLLVLINTGYLVAGIFGQLCSSYISAEFGWRMVFFFFSASYFIFFVLSTFILPVSSKTKQEQTSLATLSQLFKVKGLIKSYFITFTLLFSSVAFYDAIERSFEGTSQILRMVGLIGALLSLFTGNLIERWKTSGALFVGMTIGIFSFLFMLIFQKGLMYPLTILFISSIALLIPTIVTRIGTISGEHRIKALSLYSFILLIGASFAPPVVLHLTFNQVLILLLSFYILNLFMIRQN